MNINKKSVLVAYYVLWLCLQQLLRHLLQHLLVAQR